MNPKWHFNPRQPCERMRDSANEAFFTAEEAWDQEIANRVQKIREGTVKGRPADEVFRDIRSRYK